MLFPISFQFHFSQDNAHFFVNEQRAANALRSLNGLITVRDGSKLYINVRQCPPPKITGTDYADGGGGGGGGGSGGSINEDVLKVCLYSFSCWKCVLYIAERHWWEPPQCSPGGANVS